MSLPVPITIAQGLAILHSTIATWATPRRGIVKICRRSQVRTEMFMQEGKLLDDTPRILICYMGSKARGSFERKDTQHREDRQWMVIVIYGKGFASQLAEQQAGMIESVYDSVESLRDLIRCMLNVSEEFPLSYNGIEPMANILGPNASFFIDADAISFSTANDIGQVSPTNPVEESD